MRRDEGRGKKSVIAGETWPLFLDEAQFVPRTLAAKTRRFVDVTGSLETEAKHKELSRQLLERDVRAVQLWEEHSESVQILAGKISLILKENLTWPNTHFIPDDRVGLILRSPLMDLEIEETTIEIERCAGRKLSAGEWKERSLGSFVELVRYLLRRDA